MTDKFLPCLHWLNLVQSTEHGEFWNPDHHKKPSRSLLGMNTGNEGLWQRIMDNMTQADIQAYTCIKFVSSRYKQKYNMLSNCSFHFFKVLLFTIFRHNPCKVKLPRSPYTFMLSDQVSLSGLCPSPGVKKGKLWYFKQKLLCQRHFFPWQAR